jgi:hypothetical protein
MKVLWINNSSFGAFQSDWGREKVGERLAGIEEVFGGSSRHDPVAFACACMVTLL